MAIWLLFTLGAVALMYFLLGAEFLAAIQLVVYVGGTLILIIFGVMLTSKNPFTSLDIPPYERFIGWAVGLIGAALMVFTGLAVAAGSATSSQTIQETADTAASFGVTELGRSMLTKYMIPFEVAGVLLLVVMIGAAYIAKGRHEQADSGSSGGGPTA
ncbi:MAG: hypothetical protein D8M59_09495 [Planctomycetes bacterium]|nr:hypothetical protein [Planctomycetota bacterium]NOG54300.1 NADH-quinone oxidoreductase subunit J [Planctomycetota bacterium]